MFFAGSFFMEVPTSRSLLGQGGSGMGSHPSVRKFRVSGFFNWNVSRRILTQTKVDKLTSWKHEKTILWRISLNFGLLFDFLEYGGLFTLIMGLMWCVAEIRDKRRWQGNSAEWWSEATCSNCASTRQESENSASWRGYFSSWYWERKGLMTVRPTVRYFYVDICELHLKSDVFVYTYEPSSIHDTQLWIRPVCYCIWSIVNLN